MNRISFLLLAVFGACAAVPAPDRAAPPLPPVAGQINELTQDASPYALVLEERSFTPGSPATLSFRIAQDTATLTSFEREHEKLLHLIIVRNDLTAFQHLHPELDRAGMFSVPITFEELGTYAMFADFRPTKGNPVVLRRDLDVGAPSASRPLVVDTDPEETGGYVVTPAVLSPVPAGVETMLLFEISRDGRPVADLRNHLGAKGHAVILKEASLAYHHAHPSEHGAAHGDHGEAAAPGTVHFLATFPAPGRYAVFTQFRPEGNLVTTSFSYEVSTPPDGTGLGAGHVDEDAAREIRVEAYRFSYEPREIRVRAGEPVVLVLSTRDVAHSFTVEDLGLSATILPGKEARLAFTPERAGRYHVGCDVACGAGHPGMAADGGTLVVEAGD